MMRGPYSRARADLGLITFSLDASRSAARAQAQSIRRAYAQTAASTPPATHRYAEVSR